MKKTYEKLHRNLIGERVREARMMRRRPLSQDELAGKLAAKGLMIDQTAISRIESRTRYVMDYEAAALAKCLRVSVAWLYGEINKT